MTRSLALLGVAAVLVALSVAAAPALSKHWTGTEPVEWSMPAPGPSGARAAASPRGFVSPVVRPGRRFNIVGFRWRGGAEPAISVRARAGGRWGRWTAVPAHSDGAADAGGGEPEPAGVSAPVWAGDADALQYRLSRPVPGLRFHLINTLGTATRAARVRRDVAGAVRNVATAVLAVGQAEAQSPAPPIVPRSSWGGDSCAPRDHPAHGEVKAAFIHHTVTANSYTREQAPAAVLGICRFHRNGNGWDDVGYNFLVDRFGTIYEGRAGGTDQAVIGAQAQGFNAETTGIANIGDHTSLPQSEAALSAIARLIRWKLPLHGAPTAGTVQLTSAGGSTNKFSAGRIVTLPRVLGHRDGNQTACPGDALYDQLPLLRQKVGSVEPVDPAPGGRPATSLVLAATPGTVAYSQPVALAGTLRQASGGAVANEPVVVQRLTPGGWRNTAAARTDGSGRFSLRLAPRARAELRARFAGDANRRPATSRRTVVLVRPRVSVARSVARARVGQRAVISGAVSPAKPRLVLVTERKTARGFGRVARSVVRARRGRYRASVPLRAPGLHRVTAVFTGDAANIAGSSPWIHVRVLGGSGGATAPARR